jgi:hypothetical protein
VVHRTYTRSTPPDNVALYQTGVRVTSRHAE